MRSRIDASNVAPVTFSWSGTQLETVGGIPVYDRLSINVVSLNTATTNSVYEFVLKFVFGTRTLKAALWAGRSRSSKNRAANGGSSSGTASTSKCAAASWSGGFSSAVHNADMSQAIRNRSRSQNIVEMSLSGQSSMRFRHVCIWEFQLTASYPKQDQVTPRSCLILAT